MRDKASKALLEEKSAEYYEELVQVAAVVIAALEAWHDGD